MQKSSVGAMISTTFHPIMQVSLDGATISDFIPGLYMVVYYPIYVVPERRPRHSGATFIAHFCMCIW